jgi:uroporphyrinogen-III decarboxylase
MSALPAEEVKKLSIERCQLAGKNGGFILAPGCDLPNATPLENVLAMVEGAQEA